ncbi:MAG: hypothetical protein LIO97_02280 [Tannerellaceae bacterium]|nr:hypothetical protein [Tannerellaceae bacterium]
MSTNKSGKLATSFYILFTIAGLVFACSSIIPNKYVQLVIVFLTLGFGMYGIMKNDYPHNVLL